MTAFAAFARRYLIADAAALSPTERWRSALAGLLGMALFEALLAVMPVAAESRRALAPLGATAVILFALPHSPLAQPWSVVGGLFLGAGLGFAAGTWLPQPAAAALAVAGTIWCMAWLRCLHPPGGAMALLLSMAAADHAAPGATLLAVACNAGAILVAVLAVNNLIPHRRYPQCTPAAVAEVTAEPAPTGIDHRDLQQALQDMDTYLDVSEEDLIELFHRATLHAFRRHLDLRCGQAMRPAVAAVEFATGLNEAWDLMRSRRLAALPVLDRAGRPLGVLAVEDFLRHVPPDRGRSMGENVRRLLRATPGSHSDKPEVAGQIMRETRDGLRVAREDEPLVAVADALLLARQPLVPVVDASGRLAGVLGCADLGTALLHHVALERTAPQPA